jgi:dipicolinate synthase subunit A
MEELPFTLHTARVLILGFGRVGKLTAHRMNALGARVTVAAQDYGDLAWAAAYGYESCDLRRLSWELGGFDLIVNTIPAVVLDRSKLRWVRPEVFLLDLASAPGGVDREAAQDLGLRVLQAPGLPGRTAPVTAAAAIRDSVYHILWEQEEGT